MKRLVTLALVVSSLAGCSGSLQLNRPNCGGGVCVRVRLTEPILLNQLVPVTITIESEEDIAGLKIYLATSPLNVPIEGDRQWTADVRAGQIITVQSALRFTEVGLFYIFAQALNPRIGGFAADYVRVELTLTGATIYLSGTPLPITPFVINTPPPYILNPQGTPLPIPTRASFPPTPTRAPYP